VVQRGTANSIRQLAPYVAGKTGTTDDENDAWFVGFTNDVTVAIWVGYDNGNGRRTLGAGQTGGHVAVPIFKPIIEAAWATHAPQAALAPPSPEAKRQLVVLPVDLASGSRAAGGGAGTINEYFRLDPSGRVAETQYRLVSELEAETLRQTEMSFGERPEDYPYAGRVQGPGGYRILPQQPQYNPPTQYNRGLFGGWFTEEPDRQLQQQQQRPRRLDPDYFWNHRTN